MLRNLVQNKFLAVPIKFNHGNCAFLSAIRMAERQFGEDGSGAPPLVIMHGLLGSKTNFGGIGRGLATKLQPKRKVILVDARNHGESPHSSEHTYADLSEDMEELTRNKGVEKVAVLGHSMGGKAMMHFALDKPDLVERLIIVDISPFALPRDLNFMNNVLSAMNTVGNNVPQDLPISEARKLVEKELIEVTGDRGTTSFIIQNLKKLPSGKIGWATNTEALLQNLPTIGSFPHQLLSNQFKGPTIFVAGSHSSFFKTEDWPKIQKLFPNSELHMLETGHLVHFEEPAKFMEIVADFLNKT